ncbi:hypothetical protein ACLS0R_14690 [Comamonas jiangduensis]|uniref:hypothetical protein n=1 Tax=Comamonas jiangduensis TaxID=1194168 RepID=UPI003BF905AF
MSATGPLSVNYFDAARRHFQDAGTLLGASRQANAGQLLGIAAECGIKAILVASGVPVDTEGSIDSLPGVKGRGFKKHLPDLHQALTDLAAAIPDSRKATTYLSALTNLAHFSDWQIEHRYWRDAALPLASVARWQLAAGDVMAVLDQAKEDGVL